jgi:signal transduction histidine kinase
MSGLAINPDLAEAVLDAMAVGIAVFDADQRAVTINRAYCESIGMPSDSFPPGTRLADMLRVGAYRGVFGPGDPEAQAAAALAADRSRPGRLRRRSFNGRHFDLYTAPVAGGGHVVCAVETTALLAARDEAQKRAAQLTTAFSTLRTGLAAFTPNDDLLFANARFAELMGLPPLGLRSHAGFAALLDAMAERDEYAGLEGEAFIATQRALDRSRPAAARRLRANGQVIDVASDPLPHGGWTMTVTDISPLARAEDEARRRAALFHSILENIPHGVSVYGPDRRVAMVNRAYTEIMAGSAVAVGDHIETVVRRRAEDGEYGPGDPDEMFARHAVFDILSPQVRRRRRPNGTVLDVRIAALPDGGHVSVLTDVTPLTEAEAESARRAEEMAVMLANIRHGVLLWGPDRRLIASNAMAADMLHHPPGALVPGRTEADLLDSMRARGELGEGERALRAVRHLSTLDRSRPYLRQMTTTDGRVLDIRSDPTPGGGWVTTFTDVTEARNAEIELRRAKETAESANRAKSRFLATMSHELRTPLNAVIGFSDALLHEAANPSGERVEEFARQINQSGRHLLGLINIILDVAGIESGRFDLADDCVDIAGLVRFSIHQTEATAQAAEVTVIIALPQGLPQLRADEGKLRQVMGALLSNAVKFTPAGGTVTIGAEELPDGLQLTLRDTGIGIPEADIERVFEPFTQLDGSLARRFQGTGVGLYLARALVAGHGGRLSLASRVGTGTTATIWLPAERLVDTVRPRLVVNVASAHHSTEG